MKHRRGDIVSAPRGRRTGTVSTLIATAAIACAFGAWSLPAVPRIGAGSPPARGERSALRVGKLTLRACGSRGAFCGRLRRALDPGGETAGEVSVYFELYPHASPGAAHGTLVATEGGPGFPATGSRDDYLALFEPLMRDHDVLIMDNRGTGRSGALDCPRLQAAERWTVDLVAACGVSLGARAHFYGTANAADDLAAIVAALGIGQIDLYGDSYGTYFEQAFATRHPGMLRSLVLDGAYPLSGPDYAWYPTYAPAMRDKFNLACARYPACAALPGSSIDHMMPALAALRTAPFRATGIDVDGNSRQFPADASSFAIVLFGAAPAYSSLREADAAARAFAAGDRAPLLRLMAETAAAVDSRDSTHDVAQWSAGLAAAVTCHDPAQIFDMRLEPVERAIDRDRALEDRRRRFPDTYAPFTIDEYRGMPLDYSFLDECVAWPVAPPHQPASQLGEGVQFPDVPALVISGEFDDVTSMADGAAVAAAFPRATQVRVANSFHVNALPRARSGCAAGLVRRFFRTLLPGDTACAAGVPPVRLVSSFVRQSADLEPAEATAGNRAATPELRTSTAAMVTAGDILVRAVENSSGRGAGLRGGTYRVQRNAGWTHALLDRVRWVDDVVVSGTIDAPPGRDGMVRARLRVSTADGRAGVLTVRWPRMSPADATAQITGELGGIRVAARAPAP